MPVISGGSVIGLGPLAPLPEPIVMFAGVPVNGVAGTGANILDKGRLLVDTTNGKLYINTNTLASPTWTVVGTQV